MTRRLLFTHQLIYIRVSTFWLFLAMLLGTFDKILGGRIFNLSWVYANTKENRWVKR